MRDKGMLTLTDRDREVCVYLAKQASGQESDISEKFNILATGFAQFGSEDGILLYPSRQKYFEALHQKLLKNYIYAGRDFDYFTKVLHGRGVIIRIVSSIGRYQNDIEDIVQDILENIWKSKYIERYNPLISSWTHFIYKPVRNYVTNYVSKAKRKKRYHPNTVHTDFDYVYNTSQEETPENVCMVEELFVKWEEFLKTQPAFFRGSQVNHTKAPFKRLCTLLPPGSIEIPTQEELTLYFLRKGTNECRVALPDLYHTGAYCMVDSEDLVDYISMDETTLESITDSKGNLVIQKFFINPLYLEYKKSLVKSFDYLNFYMYLRDGLTLEEIATLVGLSYRSVPYWLNKLESLFRSFWLITDLVPLGLKRLSTESRKCPVCSKLNYKNLGVCESCASDLSGVSNKNWFSVYPWPRVFMKRETKEQYERRVGPVVIKRCAM
jgi:RNA polymerase sigma factor (sigma-70 family)